MPGNIVRMENNFLVGRNLHGHRRLAALLVGGLVAVAGVSVASLASPNPASAQLGGAKSTTIGVKSLSFDPNKVTVKVNEPITFVWRQTVAHNIVFDDKTLPKSKTQNKGTWPLKGIAKAGTYKYHCTLHPGMNGQITVK